MCVTDDPDSVKGLIATVLDGYNDLPSYRGVMDQEGAAGPADVSIVGDEASVRAGLERFASAGTTDFSALGDPDEPRRGGSDPRRSSRTWSPDPSRPSAVEATAQVPGRGPVAGTVAVEQPRASAASRCARSTLPPYLNLARTVVDAHAAGLGSPRAADRARVGSTTSSSGCNTDSWVRSTAATPSGSSTTSTAPVSCTDA